MRAVRNTILLGWFKRDVWPRLEYPISLTLKMYLLIYMFSKSARYPEIYLNMDIFRARNVMSPFEYLFARCP